MVRSYQHWATCSEHISQLFVPVESGFMTNLSVIVTQTVCCFVRLKRLFSVNVLIIEIAIVLWSEESLSILLLLDMVGLTCPANFF